MSSLRPPTGQGGWFTSDPYTLWEMGHFLCGDKDIALAMSCGDVDVDG